jgi:hypothetical protein
MPSLGIARIPKVALAPQICQRRMRHRFQASFRRVLLFHLLEIRVQAIQL